MNGGRNETHRGGTSHGGGCRQDSSTSPHHPNLSYQQHPAHETGKGRTTRRERRQGQVEVDLQIGHSPQETIINKAVTAQSPLKGH